MKESEKTESKKSLAELGDGLNSIAAILNPCIINAFCHRDCRDPDEVRIAIFPDRVEVRNPGTLMEGVTLRTLKTAKVSRRRTPPHRRLPAPHPIHRGLGPRHSAHS